MNTAEASKATLIKSHRDVMDALWDGPPGGMTAGETAAATAVSPATIYSSLSSLVCKGLVRKSGSKPYRYAPQEAAEVGPVEPELRRTVVYRQGGFITGGIVEDASDCEGRP